MPNKKYLKIIIKTIRKIFDVYRVYDNNIIS